MFYSASFSKHVAPNLAREKLPSQRLLYSADLIHSGGEHHVRALLCIINGRLFDLRP